MSFLAQPTSRPIKSESWRGAQAEHSVTRPGEQKPAKDDCSWRWGDLVPGKWQVTMLCQVHSACRCWVCKASHFLPPPICIHISIPHLTGNVIIPQTEAANLSGHLLSLNLLICSGMFWFFFSNMFLPSWGYTRRSENRNTAKELLYMYFFFYQQDSKSQRVCPVYAPSWHGRHSHFPECDFYSLSSMKSIV